MTADVQRPTPPLTEEELAAIREPIGELLGRLYGMAERLQAKAPLEGLQVLGKAQGVRLAASLVRDYEPRLVAEVNRLKDAATGPTDEQLAVWASASRFGLSASDAVVLIADLRASRAEVKRLRDEVDSWRSSRNALLSEVQRLRVAGGVPSQPPIPRAIFDPDRPGIAETL